MFFSKILQVKQTHPGVLKKCILKNILLLAYNPFLIKHLDRIIFIDRWFFMLVQISDHPLQDIYPSIFQVSTQVIAYNAEKCIIQTQ